MPEVLGGGWLSAVHGRFLAVGSVFSLIASLGCALISRAVVYRAFLRPDSTHRYLAWYEPFVGALSIVALGVLMAIVGLRLWRRRPEPRVNATAGLWLRVSVLAMAIFVIEESLERSLHSGSVQLVDLSLSSWLVLAVAIAALAALVVAIARSVVVIATKLLPDPLHVPLPRRPLVWRTQIERTTVGALRAGGVGLRAPPFAG